MAGTRLLIHLTFLLEIIFLVVLSASTLCPSLSFHTNSWPGQHVDDDVDTGGIPPDLLCRRIHSFVLYHWNEWTGGFVTGSLSSSALQRNEVDETEKTLQGEESGGLDFPAMTFVCDEDQVVYWQSTLWKIRKRLQDHQHNQQQQCTGVEGNDEETSRTTGVTSSSMHALPKVIVRPDIDGRLTMLCQMSRNTDSGAYTNEPQQEEQQQQQQHKQKQSSSQRQLHSDLVTNADVYICPFDSGGDNTKQNDRGKDESWKNRVSISQGSIVFHPSSGSDSKTHYLADGSSNDRILSALISSESPTSIIPMSSENDGATTNTCPTTIPSHPFMTPDYRLQKTRLHLRMWVGMFQRHEDNDGNTNVNHSPKQDWKHAMHALNQHIQENRYDGIAYQNWPCLLPSVTGLLEEKSYTPSIVPQIQWWNENNSPDHMKLVSTKGEIPAFASGNDTHHHETTATLQHDYQYQLDIASFESAEEDGDGMWKFFGDSGDEDRTDDDGDFFIDMIWNPTEHPLYFVDESSSPSSADTFTKTAAATTHVQLGQNSYLVALNAKSIKSNESNRDDSEDHGKLLRKQLTPILQRFWSSCLSSEEDYDVGKEIAESDGNSQQHASLQHDGSLPTLLLKRWYQKRLGSLYSTTMLMLKKQEERQEHLDSFFWHMPYEKKLYNSKDLRRIITSDSSVDKQTYYYDWRVVVNVLVEGARKKTVDGRYSEALQDLERVQLVLEDAYAPNLVLDMPPEQYLAILAPLVFPLLLPLVLGLVREIKRYRKLKSPSTNSSDPKL